MKTTKELKRTEKVIKAVTTVLYWKSPLALAIHFGINLLLAQLVAYLFIKQAHADVVTAGWILLVSRVLFLGYGVASVRGIETYGGELVDFFWTNTHVVAKNGLWPMYLYPIFKFADNEHVSFEKTDIVIPPFQSTDVKGLSFMVGGSIRWEVGKSNRDAAKFTETTERFYEMMAQEGKIASDSVVKTNDFRLATSILRDSVLYNNAVIAKIDPIMIRKEFGVILKKGILSVEVTSATDKILTIETKGNEYLKQVEEYMRRTNCTFADAKNAVDSSQNGAQVINIGGTGNALPIINLGGGIGRP